MQHQDVAHREPYPLTRGRTPVRLWSLLGWGLSGLVVFGVYSNVLSDDTALRAQTEQLARQHAACGDHCRLTQTEIHRSLFEYRVDYEIEGTPATRVTCRRTGIVVGPEECRVP